ncbi:SdpI family protein [Acidithiobacillus sulfurivorans]|uniref:SdpI family protein n=1 Tax=Acidithiobacillus sulfurivorans TaxID=1958756 RepID=A0ABS6A192_9PROT|nr:SdpI family protein [Acidithiobacillus sulfurivorans]MBU2761267.1 SdpI family protein [Acidithiobacillus sulfurivorans]
MFNDLHNILPSVLLFLLGVVSIGVGLPLYWNQIPSNPFYGIRIPKALESEESWYAINHVGGKRIVVAGICFIMLAFILIFSPQIFHHYDRQENVLLFLGIVSIGVIIGITIPTKSNKKEQ